MGPGPSQLGFGFRGEAGWWVGGAGGDCPKHGGSHPGKICGSIFQIVNMKYANAYTLPWFCSWGGKGLVRVMEKPPPHLVLEAPLCFSSFIKTL